jgi:hypothetical protein
MTVQTTTLRADYTGNGSTTAFTVPFYFLDNTHIVVYRTQISTGAVSTLALTSDYTVIGAGVGTGGTITCVVAPTSDQKISILRNVPFTQLTHYVDNDPFPAASHEKALDQLTMEAQQLQEAISRALTLAANSTGVSTSLPTPVSNQVIGWNSTGTALANIDAGTLASNVSYGQTNKVAYSGNGVITNFVLPSNGVNVNNVQAYIHGVRQTPGVDYTLGNDLVTITFTTAPPSGTNNVLFVWQQALLMGVVPDASVSTNKIVDAAVTSAKIVDGGVTTAKHADGSVTTAKIADANVTYAKIQTVAAGKVLGRDTSGNGVVQELPLAVDSSGNVGIGTSSPGTYGPFAVYKNTTDGTSASGNFVNAGTTSSYAGINITAGTVTYQQFGDAAGNAIGTAGVMLRTTSNHPLLFGTNNTERARIDSSGWFKFIQGAAIAYIGDASSISGGSAGQSCLRADGSALTFAVGGSTERARIDSSGNLLVGTTTASGKVSVNSGTAFGGVWTAASNAGTYYFHSFVAGSTTVGSITSTNGTNAIYATSSDYRLKEDVKPMTGALSKVVSLKPCTYKWKLNGAEDEGFIAHELAEVFPHAVTGEKDGVDEDGNPVYQGIDTSFLVATLTAAIQEQQALITTLTERIAALENK